MNHRPLKPQTLERRRRRKLQIFRENEDAIRDQLYQAERARTGVSKVTVDNTTKAERKRSLSVRYQPSSKASLHHYKYLQYFIDDDGFKEVVYCDNEPIQCTVSRRRELQRGQSGYRPNNRMFDFWIDDVKNDTQRAIQSMYGISPVVLSKKAIMSNYVT